jgi:CheY-like chemotaxis protein
MAGRSQEPAAAPVPPVPANGARTEMRGHILLVEDNLINQQVAVGILQIQGYTVTVANNGKEALDAHGQGAFDVILMDCHMPEMDGFEATMEIRKREQSTASRRVPIIALTANAMATDREECLNAGMDDHLSKPFSMQTMQDMLDRWIRKPASPDAAAAALAARATAKAAEVLDRQTLEELSRTLTPQRLASIISLYLAESPKLMERIQRAAGTADAAEIARSAHSLKSSSANVGAAVLSRYCEQLEASARRADTEEARRLLGKLESEHSCVHSALKAEFELLTASKA